LFAYFYQAGACWKYLSLWPPQSRFQFRVNNKIIDGNNGNRTNKKETNQTIIKENSTNSVFISNFSY
jgi:hypothetical protein